MTFEVRHMRWRGWRSAFSIENGNSRPYHVYIPPTFGLRIVDMVLYHIINFLNVFFYIPVP